MSEPVSDPTNPHPRPSNVSGVVLAGGHSRRMGRDKCALELGGRSLLQRAVDALEVVCGEVAVVRAPEQPPPASSSTRPLRQLEDELADGGPLAGIAAGLAATEAEVAIVVACDAPFLQPGLLRLLVGRALEGAPLVVPEHEGRPQLLCSAWRRDALPAVRERLEAGVRAVGSMLELPGVALLQPREWADADPEGRSFVNVNALEDLERALELLDGLAQSEGGTLSEERRGPAHRRRCSRARRTRGRRRPARAARCPRASAPGGCRRASA